MITYEHAKKYLSKGWSVIPVTLTLKDGKVEKKPAIPWREYQTRRPTDEELHQWFDTGKYNAIGLITGKISNIVVVDLDDPTKSEEFYSPLISKTISGGYHYYYKWDGELRNDARIEGEAIDFRGDGGYVVLPPSGINEKKYVWHKTIETMYLSPLPETIRKKLVVPTQPKQIAPSGSLPTATEGDRNMTAAVVAGKIIRSVQYRKLESIGFLAFQAWNHSHVNPPLDNRELRTVWDSIVSRHTREEKSTISVFTGNKAVQEYQTLHQKYGDGITTGYAELDQYFKFLPEQLYLLSAPTHQGKTTLALNMAARIANQGHPVLFASLEQGVFIVPRVKTMLNGTYPDKLTMLTSSQTVGITDLITTIEGMEQTPKLVVIDHLHFINKVGEDTTGAIDNMIVEMQNMAKRLQIPVLVIAHVRKLNGDRPPELDDLRDSSSLSQVPGVVMLLYREKNDPSFQANSYLSPFGALFIAKNRVQGKSGVLRFELKDSGEFVFGGKRL